MLQQNLEYQYWIEPAFSDFFGFVLVLLYRPQEFSKLCRIQPWWIVCSLCRSWWTNQSVALWEEGTGMVIWLRLRHYGTLLHCCKCFPFLCMLWLNLFGQFLVLHSLYCNIFLHTEIHFLSAVIHFKLTFDFLYWYLSLKGILIMGPCISNSVDHLYVYLVYSFISLIGTGRLI